ncbi:sterol-sensing domain of SREBP cleavage-activation-domain-containing protein [Polychytrium aggregatum]|uniref:sterol-sensing domain of SREBP cleavage-activation-domain-containing protein n=1 Tax=Polychytrium aggregatum TaxID=110093 RepID=UPI0022FF09E7|nr:sterol-sensing domain of SREBP cleavage-activation-domain-containing protein [Polychytrium aggregatum]KAI9209504.1 sterol-sensing domain of SREBP cleavage-activation-domain-containing protein [Polychytrium aggregatum]
MPSEGLVRSRIDRLFYHHGLVCASRPYSTLLFSFALIIYLSYPVLSSTNKTNPFVHLIEEHRAWDELHTRPTDSWLLNLGRFVLYQASSASASSVVLLLCYAIVFVYISLVMQKIDLVKSKFGIGFGAILMVVASMLMAVGLCILMGFDQLNQLVPWYEILPFLIIAIGVENILNLVKAIVQTSMDLPVKKRVGLGLSQIGSKMALSMGYQMLFLVGGSLIDIPALQEFCLVASLAVVIGFLLQITFFTAILSIDIRRLELSDLYRLKNPAHSADGKAKEGQRKHLPRSLVLTFLIMLCLGFGLYESYGSRRQVGRPIAPLPEATSVVHYDPNTENEYGQAAESLSASDRPSVWPPSLPTASGSAGPSSTGPDGQINRADHEPNATTPAASFDAVIKFLRAPVLIVGLVVSLLVSIFACIGLTGFLDWVLKRVIFAGLKKVASIIFWQYSPEVSPVDDHDGDWPDAAESLWSGGRDPAHTANPTLAPPKILYDRIRIATIKSSLPYPVSNAKLIYKDEGDAETGRHGFQQVLWNRLEKLVYCDLLSLRPLRSTPSASSLCRTLARYSTDYGTRIIALEHQPKYRLVIVVLDDGHIDIWDTVDWKRQRLFKIMLGAYKITAHCFFDLPVLDSTVPQKPEQPLSAGPTLREGALCIALSNGDLFTLVYTRPSEHFGFHNIQRHVPITTIGSCLAGLQLFIGLADGSIVALDSMFQAHERPGSGVPIGQRTFSGHADKITHLNHQADLNVLFSGDAKGQVRIWSCTTGECLLVLEAEPATAPGLAPLSGCLRSDSANGIRLKAPRQCSSRVLSIEVYTASQTMLDSAVHLHVQKESRLIVAVATQFDNLSLFEVVLRSRSAQGDPGRDTTPLVEAPRSHNSAGSAITVVRTRLILNEQVNGCGFVRIVDTDKLLGFQRRAVSESSIRSWDGRYVWDATDDEYAPSGNARKSRPSQDSQNDRQLWVWEMWLVDLHDRFQTSLSPEPSVVQSKFDSIVTQRIAVGLDDFDGENMMAWERTTPAPGPSESQTSDPLSWLWNPPAQPSPLSPAQPSHGHAAASSLADPRDPSKNSAPRFGVAVAVLEEQGLVPATTIPRQSVVDTQSATWSMHSYDRVATHVPQDGSPLAYIYDSDSQTQSDSTEGDDEGGRYHSDNGPWTPGPSLFGHVAPPSVVGLADHHSTPPIAAPTCTDEAAMPVSVFEISGVDAVAHSSDMLLCAIPFGNFLKVVEVGKHSPGAGHGSGAGSKRRSSAGIADPAEDGRLGLGRSESGTTLIAQTSGLALSSMSAPSTHLATGRKKRD